MTWAENVLDRYEVGSWMQARGALREEMLMEYQALKISEEPVTPVKQALASESLTKKHKFCRFSGARKKVDAEKKSEAENLDTSDSCFTVIDKELNEYLNLDVDWIQEGDKQYAARSTMHDLNYADLNPFALSRFVDP